MVLLVIFFITNVPMLWLVCPLTKLTTSSVGCNYKAEETNDRETDLTWQ